MIFFSNKNKQIFFPEETRTAPLLKTDTKRSHQLFNLINRLAPLTTSVNFTPYWFHQRPWVMNRRFLWTVFGSTLLTGMRSRDNYNNIVNSKPPLISSDNKPQVHWYRLLNWYCMYISVAAEKKYNKWYIY